MRGGDGETEATKRVTTTAGVGQRCLFRLVGIWGALRGAGGNWGQLGHDYDYGGWGGDCPHIPRQPVPAEMAAATLDPDVTAEVMPGELGWCCHPRTELAGDPSPPAACWAGGQRLASAAAGPQGAPAPPPARLSEHNEA